MKIEIEFPDDLVKKIVTGIMENFPEASAGSALVCLKWNYDDLKFLFNDQEGDKMDNIDQKHLFAAFRGMFSGAWPKGCTPPPHSVQWDDWDNWLCQCDAKDFDAFVQLACIGKVIYD